MNECSTFRQSFIEPEIILFNNEQKPHRIISMDTEVVRQEPTFVTCSDCIIFVNKIVQ